MSEAPDLLALLRQYAAIDDGSGWATAMRRAVARIETLEEYVLSDCFCPCCEGETDCNDDCTYEDDCPTDAQAMYYAREVMKEQR